MLSWIAVSFYEPHRVKLALQTSGFPTRLFRRLCLLDVASVTWVERHASPTRREAGFMEQTHVVNEAEVKVIMKPAGGALRRKGIGPLFSPLPLLILPLASFACTVAKSSV